MSNCTCGAPSDPRLKLNDKPVCRVCAHNASHSRRLGDNYVTAISGVKTISVNCNVAPDTRGVFEIACPVTDDKGNVIPWGTYPNIDWS